MLFTKFWDIHEKMHRYYRFLSNWNDPSTTLCATLYFKNSKLYRWTLYFTDKLHTSQINFFLHSKHINFFLHRCPGFLIWALSQIDCASFLQKKRGTNWRENQQQFWKKALKYVVFEFCLYFVVIAVVCDVQRKRKYKKNLIEKKLFIAVFAHPVSKCRKYKIS